MKTSRYQVYESEAFGNDGVQDGLLQRCRYYLLSVAFTECPRTYPQKRQVGTIIYSTLPRAVYFGPVFKAPST